MQQFGPRSIVHAAENIKGGVGAYLRDLVAAQRESFGPGVVVAVLPESQRDMVGTPEGVEVVPFDDRGNRFSSSLRLARKAREVIAAAGPDVVHVHSTFAGAVLRPLLRLRRPRPAVVYCAHGWAFDRDTSPVARTVAGLLERALAPLCDAVVCVSRYELEQARDRRIAPSRLVEIDNGIPREPPVPPAGLQVEWPEGRRRILFVGRFDRQKGADVLLAALPALDGAAFAFLAGDSVLGDSGASAPPQNAAFTGWLSPAELQAYYATADVVVVPSRWEAFGLSAVEAMRAGRAVVASRVGGLAETVVDGVTGVLVPAEDPAALAEALGALTDEELRAMGTAGLARFEERFTIDREHRELTELYARLVGRS